MAQPFKENTVKKEKKNAKRTLLIPWGYTPNFKFSGGSNDKF